MGETMARLGRRARRRRAGSDDHDEVALSGWLFADLILGLFIVFLGAVTVRYVLPEEPEPEIGEAIGLADGQEDGLICETAMSPEWVSLQLTRGAPIEQIIAEAEAQIADAVEAREDLGEDVVFPFALFFGRPEPATPAGQRAVQGTGFAAQMRARVLEAMPERFPDAAYRDFYGGGDTTRVGVDIFPEVTVCR
jgi:hypothetical protein